MADRNLDNHRDCFISFFSFSSFGMQSSKEQELMYAVGIEQLFVTFCDNIFILGGVFCCFRVFFLNLITSKVRPESRRLVKKDRKVVCF